MFFDKYIIRLLQMRDAWIYGRNPLGLSVRHARKAGEIAVKTVFSVT